MTQSLQTNAGDGDKQVPQAAMVPSIAFEADAWLAAVVGDCDDAIVSKTLDGVIRTWNGGAERLFGYSANECIGKPITLLFPEERLSEEDDILGRLRSGQRIDHFETVRRRKDGKDVHVSVTVSPVRNEAGVIVGASKIARNIGDQKEAGVQQSLLLREMNHRIKNLFSLTAALVALSARGTTGGEALAADLAARLRALARAHELTMPDLSAGDSAENSTTLRALLEAILAPHDDSTGSRITIGGCDAPLSGSALTSVALLLHELATNAAKHGALALADGRLSVELAMQDDRLTMTWAETNARSPKRKERREGFGSTLERAALTGIGATLTRSWRSDGLTIDFAVPLQRLVSVIS
ncbi:sensor histidine kinase [Croceicoccus marinus]|nr:PAS domain S-box protein [Croceicoccus marinus]